MKTIISRAVSSVLLLAGTVATSAAPVKVSEDPDTGLKSWKVVEEGFGLELIQLYPDYVQAVYASRDLPKVVLDGIRQYCFFGTIARNETDTELSYRVADWRYVASGGKQYPLKTKSEWLVEWRRHGSDYGWSILPDDMVFDPGDWAQGFTTVKLPPGGRFDLIYSWRHHGKTYAGKLNNLSCAPAEPPVRP
jgi:hypothetical protein